MFDRLGSHIHIKTGCGAYRLDVSAVNDVRLTLEGLDRPSRGQSIGVRQSRLSLRLTRQQVGSRILHRLVLRIGRGVVCEKY